MKDFKLSIYNEEFDSYADSFDQFFRRHDNEQQHVNKASDDSYNNKVNAAFLQEWGIKLFDLHSISSFISSELFRSKKSVKLFKAEEFYRMIRQSSDFSDTEITSYLNQLMFLQREDILIPPEGHNKTEVYPWRYNRSISYLLRPIIKVAIQNEEHF
jgi:hypothetical protein